MNPIINLLKGKNVAILGFGKEGQSSYHYIRKYLPKQELTIADEKEIDTSSLKYVKIVSGKDYQNLEGFDYIIKSPGIVVQQEKIIPYLTSQTDLFLRFFQKQCIGVTGTKGKSTTASLLYHCFKKGNYDVCLMGNIGLPAFDQLDQIHENTVIVYELSSHQLEYVKYSPHIGIYLNIFEEHLDHYGSFEKYQKAKENIYRYQKEDDVILYAFNLESSCMKANKISISMQENHANIYVSTDAIYFPNETILKENLTCSLIGQHNLYNIAIVFWVCKLYGMSMKQCQQALASFHPLAHRLEYVGYYHNLHWYDDSISTICEASIQALKSIPNTNTLLLGGLDRGIHYQLLADYLNQNPIDCVILMPDSGYQLKALLTKQNYVCVKDLKEAVEYAKKHTKKEGIVLLSPAAASYGFFQNFEERGECYQSYIKSES